MASVGAGAVTYRWRQLLDRQSGIESLRSLSWQEFERSIIQERTRAGLAAARSRGRLGGRPPALSQEDLAAAKALLHDPAITVEQVAQSSEWPLPPCTGTCPVAVPPPRPNKPERSPRDFAHRFKDFFRGLGLRTLGMRRVPSKGLRVRVAAGS